MKIPGKGVVLLMLSWLLAAPTQAAGGQETPTAQQVVQNTAEAVLAEVGARKAELEADPTLIYPLVQRTVVPHFDFTAMARSAMGRFWRKATPQQQRLVVSEFRELLVRTYATALLGYTGQTIEYPPARAGSNPKKALVPTRISAAGGPPIPINYRLKLNKDGEWMVYDVVIDGVSLVTNYRSTFSRLIQQGAAKAKDSARRMQVGIDNLIESLAEKNRKADKPMAQARLAKEAA